MATQRRFEANTLAEVLAKVQQEVGSDAKIASAQRVRSGGAFGFFQRERFEVIVDIPSSSALRSDDTRDTDDDRSSPASLLELAQQINKEERSAETTVSTESNAFADVLSRVAFQADMQSDHAPAPQRAPANAAVEVPIIPDRPAFLDEPVAAPLPDPVAPSPLPDPQPIEPEPPLPQPEPLPAIAKVVLPELTAPAPVVVTPTPAIREETPIAPRVRVTDHPLAILGLPGDFIPTDSSVVDLRARLTETLAENLPKVPVIRPSRGSIIAVVGSREEAVRIAEDLAHEFGRPDEEIVLASQSARSTPAAKVLRTVENAEDAQRSWSRRNRPTIVAIEAYPGSRDTAWAEHVLTALEPIATFGVLDATRKSEDIAAWADALGGIDCLAINNIEETVSPAAVLRAGIPVERIDGRKATPEYWALLLTERLPAA